MSKRIKPNVVAIRLAEALAIAHFVVANIVCVLGEFTPLFNSFGSKHPGVFFVLNNIDGPVYAIFKSRVLTTNDTLIFFMYTEMIIILSSAVFAGICYCAVRFILSVVSDK